jgi:hypothetical protein
MKLADETFVFVFLGGFYMAMAVLHLILFLYNRSEKLTLFIHSVFYS